MNSNEDTLTTDAEYFTGAFELTLPIDEALPHFPRWIDGKRSLALRLFQQSSEPLECRYCAMPITHVHVSFDASFPTGYTIRLLMEDKTTVTVDHIKPKAIGGDKTCPTNLCYACEHCNFAKGSDRLPAITVSPTYAASLRAMGVVVYRYHEGKKTACLYARFTTPRWKNTFFFL
jgi:hypothetical protein